MKFNKIALVVCFIGHVIARNYITGNGFRDIADYKIEGNTFPQNPQSIEEKSIIYIEADYLRYFFEDIYPKIQHPIIIVSHNGDVSAPAEFASRLDDDKIIIWFGQNCDCIHKKFYPIPIGIANAKWGHGNPTIFDSTLDILEKNAQRKHKRRQKISRLYINFTPETNKIRADLLELFKHNPFAFFAQRKPLESYLMEMSRFRFILSPFGNGLDCHRTWEALLVGTIPIVQTSTLDQLYDDLPVIIVQDWHQISQEFLESRYREMQTKTYNLEKLFIDYWVKIILSYKND